MFPDPIITPTDECADRGRGSIKNVDPILFDDSPEPIRLWPVRCALIHDNSCAIRERTIDDVAVTGDPAHISCAPKNILIADIEDVFGGAINVHQVAAGRVQNSFRFAGRSARVEKIKRMLAVEGRGWTICVHILQFSMPPNVAAFLHLDLVCRAAKNDYAPDRRAIAER